MTLTKIHFPLRFIQNRAFCDTNDQLSNVDRHRQQCTIKNLHGKVALLHVVEILTFYIRENHLSGWQVDD